LRRAAEGLRGLDAQRLAEGFDFFDKARILFQSRRVIAPSKSAGRKTQGEQTKRGEFGQLPPVPLLSHLREDPEVRG
jgi:hypothetical protein